LKKIDLLIFDLDGTLIDSKQDIAEGVNFARKALGLEPLPLEEVVQAIGDGVQALIDRVLGSEREHLKEKALQHFREYYGKHLLDHTRPQPEVPDVLQHFRAKSKAILTNKSSQFTLPILERLGLQSLFGWIECGDNPEEKKPHPGGVKRILKHFKTDPEKAVLVGDSPVDVQTGKAAGIATCIVLDGYASERAIRQSNPDWIFPSIGKLKENFV